MKTMPPAERLVAPSDAKRAAWLGLVGSSLLFVALLGLFAQEAWWQAFLQWLFPDKSPDKLLFARASLLRLVVQHLRIVASALAITLAIGVPLGIWLTRPAGKAFLPLASNLLSVGQTFPPIAVLALALPAFGFGLRPTLIALVAYGLLPVTRNTIAGLQQVDRNLSEAATAMGMTEWQKLWRVELPLATRVILAGVRTTTIYTIGTATVAPIIGAGGLGVPIIAGLTTGNLAFTLEGAIPVALLALVIDRMLAGLETALSPRGVLVAPSA